MSSQTIEQLGGENLRAYLHESASPRAPPPTSLRTDSSPFAGTSAIQPPPPSSVAFGAGGNGGGSGARVSGGAPTAQRGSPVQSRQPTPSEAQLAAGKGFAMQQLGKFAGTGADAQLQDNALQSQAAQTGKAFALAQLGKFGGQ